MRTPWRFVADLVSRNKPKAETQGERETVASEAIALEYHPPAEDHHREVEAEAVAPDAAEVAPAAVQPSSESDGGTDAPSLTTVRDEPTENVELGEPVTIAAPADLSEPAAPVATDVRQPARAASEETAAPAQLGPAPAALLDDDEKPTSEAAAKARIVPSDPKSILDEMADLDAEVAALRRELAVKLTRQNAQLRKMLARFDAR